MKEYEYRHFTQSNALEWHAPGGIIVRRLLWRTHDEWSVYQNGTKIIEQLFQTAQAAIDAYWNLSEGD